MKKLKLPVITGEEMSNRKLSDDEYLNFLFLMLKYNYTKEQRESRRRRFIEASVNAPFKLID